MDKVLTSVDLADEVVKRVGSLESRAVPRVRSVRKDISKLLVSVAPGVVVDGACRIVEQGDTPRWVAYELIHHHQQAMKSLNLKKLTRLGDGFCSWGEVDSFACYLSGPSWREQRISDHAIQRWARSEDRWWRRAAIVSTVPLNCTARGGAGDAARTLFVCDLVKQDRDEIVVKGLSWALRELAQKAPVDVRKYVVAQEADLASRVLREVWNKLETGLKQPKR